MNAIRISIVVPTYRRGASLKRVIDALGAQSKAAYETIIIDQNPKGWLDSQLEGGLDRATVIWSAEANASTARNLGFMQSSGDVVLFIDDDLEPAVDFLARAAERLESLPDIGCLCPVVVTDSADFQRASDEANALSLGSHSRAPEIVEMRSVISAAMFFRRETYEKSGGFDELLFDYARAGEDQELCFRMSRRGLSIWLDTTLAIFHDEGVAGGCELRTRPFWESRRRAIRSNVLRARLHARGRIELPAIVGLLRSSFLNRNMLRKSPAWTLRNVRLLVDALADTDRLLRERDAIPELSRVDHLARHRAAKG